MSYDIHVTKTILDINYTFNVAPMFQLALGKGGIKQLNELSREKCIKLLKIGIKDMKEKPEIYKKLNPKNGWGNYEGALTTLIKILDTLEENHNAQVSINSIIYNV